MELSEIIITIIFILLLPFSYFVVQSIKKWGYEDGYRMGYEDGKRDTFDEIKDEYYVIPIHDG